MNRRTKSKLRGKILRPIALLVVPASFFLVEFAFAGPSHSALSDSSGVNNGGAARASAQDDYARLNIAIQDFFKGNASVFIDSFTGGSSSVRDRVMLGFQQTPPMKFILNDGVKILWGWEEGQAFKNSFAIFDDKNVLRLVGVANDIPIVYSRHTGRKIRTFKDLEDLRNGSSFVPTQIALYSLDQADLDKYYSIAMRWIQASMMGFDSQCGTSEQQESCALVEKIKLPVKVLSANCQTGQEQASNCDLIRPKVVSSDVPLDQFRQ